MNFKSVYDWLVSGILCCIWNPKFAIQSLAILTSLFTSKYAKDRKQCWASSSEAICTRGDPASPDQAGRKLP